MKHLTKLQIEHLIFEESTPNSDQDAAYSHFKNCALCQEHFNAMRQFKIGVDEAMRQPPIEHDDEFAKQILRRNQNDATQKTETIVYYRFTKYMAAAVIVAFLIGGTIYFLIASFKEPSNTVIVQRDTVQTLLEKKVTTASKEVLFAENFVISEHFEDLVETEFRSHSTVITSPQKGEVVKQPIILRWQGKQEKVHINVYTNNERLLFSTSTDTDSTLISKKLPLGIFYWTITTESELLSAGKFFVKE